MKPNKPTSQISKDGSSQYISVCKRFRKLRIDNELTQPQLADILKTTRANINQIERGNHAPSIANMRILKKKFNISYEWLIDGTKED